MICILGLGLGVAFKTNATYLNYKQFFFHHVPYYYDLIQLLLFSILSLVSNFKLQPSSPSWKTIIAVPRKPTPLN